MQPECANEDPELFFYDENKENTERVQKQIELAKMVCSGCPFKAKCLETFMSEPYGIFGGTTPKERRKIIRRRTKWRK